MSKNLIPPWSRCRCTQPLRVIFLPLSVARSAPHVTDLFMFSMRSTIAGMRAGVQGTAKISCAYARNSSMLKSMKRRLLALWLGFAAACLVSAQAAERGPILDKILFDAKTQEDIGLKDVAAGRSDLWNYGTSGAAFKALPDDVKSKLDVYGVTGVQTLSILMNPYPNAAPYTVA